MATNNNNIVTLLQAQPAQTTNMGTIKQAIAVCIADELNLVPIIWGPTGWTKTATVKSLANDLGLPLHVLMLSDKEATDVGGFPSKGETTNPDGDEVGVINYLANGLIPWEHTHGKDYQCILFIDELDRAPRDVLNVAVQLLLEKSINGFKLPKGCHIVAAGNGSADTDTTRLSKAVATRLCHFYVDTTGSESLDHWVAWASRTDSDVDQALVGYARFRPALFGGKPHTYVEHQAPNPRTFTMAAKALHFCETELPPKMAKEVGNAIVVGLVGKQTGLEYVAFRSMFNECPTFEEVTTAPRKTTTKLIPKDQVGVAYALGEAFMARLYDDNKPEGSKEIDPALSKAVVQYFSRCVVDIPECKEAVVWWMRKAGAKLPSIVGSQEYQYLCR